MKHIKLTNANGKIAIVDDEDFERLSLKNWGMNRGGYAQTGMNKTTVRMHRVVINAPPGMEVDHINGNTLDNRKENLRLCTRGQNMANRSVTKKPGRLYKGIFYLRNRWQAHIQGKYIGRFETAEEAARAYDKRAKEVFGEFAKLNFERKE